MVTNLDEAVVLVFALMRSDPGTFKQGYTFENALLAVADVSEFTREQLLAAIDLERTPRQKMLAEKWNEATR